MGLLSGQQDACDVPVLCTPRMGQQVMPMSRSAYISVLLLVLLDVLSPLVPASMMLLQIHSLQSEETPMIEF